MPPDRDTLYQFDKDTGEPFDPPVIPSYEAQIAEAAASADEFAIADITDAYHAERRKRAKAHNDRIKGNDTTAASTTPDDGVKPLSKQNKDELRATATAVGADWSDDDTNDQLREKITAREGVTA